MATRYWVGGGASTNWDATGNTNWATSSGGANNASVPTTGDDVVFDANSGSGTAVLNVSASLNTLVCTGFTGTLSHTFAGTLTISGNTFTFSAGMTYSPSASSRTVTFTSTSGTCAITSAGKNFQQVIFNGAGGTFQLQDNLTATLQANIGILLTTGTLDLNGFTATVSTFNASGSSARTLTFGAGGLVVTGSSGSISFNGSSISVNKNTGSITVSGNTATNRAFDVGTAITGGLPAVALGANTSGGTVTFSGTSTIASLAATAPCRLRFTTATTFTITAAPSLSGSSSNRFQIASTSPGGAATISVAAGTVNFDNAFIEDITGAGGATFLANNSYNVAGNSGISITEPSGGAVGVIGG